MIDGPEPLTNMQAKQIIHHIRIAQAYPHIIDQMYSNPKLWENGIDYNPRVEADLWKRLKQNQTKSGLIPNPALVNLRLEVMREAIKSNPDSFFKEVLKSADRYIGKDGKAEFKVLTINDGEAGGKYDIYERYKFELKKELDANNITQEMYDRKIDQFDTSKEMTDAATYVALDPMVTMASVIGARQEQFVFNDAGQIVGLNFGLKPSVAHSKILDTGGHEVYYNKTAFHYDPAMARVMNVLGVDMIAFK
jgi:hypothetical protein